MKAFQKVILNVLKHFGFNLINFFTEITSIFHIALITSSVHF